ncbi:MAG TPA: GIY-YIG nuclease family protein [Nitrospirota bacterium]|nr:GIY-YIG nuclease family protein [Nitrospirota bacterium]
MRITSSKTKDKKSNQWFLYILRCCDSTFYTGITNDLQRRLDKHNDGTASRYTHSRRPVTLIYHERCRNKSTALKKEHTVKSLSRGEKVQYINEKAGILDCL